jgi:hypothetical protein
MATAGGDLGFYIGSFVDDAAATAYFTDRTYNQAAGYVYWNSTDSELKMWSSAAWITIGGGGGGGNDSLPDITNVFFVDKTSGSYPADGTIQFPYNSIDAAYNAAAASTPTKTNPAVVYVYPGVYTEQVTMDAEWIWIKGMTQGGEGIMANPGSGPSGVVLTATSDPVLTVTEENLGMEGVMVTSATTGVRGVAASTVAGNVTFRDCRFEDTGNFTAVRVDLVSGAGNYRFVNCDFAGQQADAIAAQSAFGGYFECRGCRIYNRVDIDGVNTGTSAKVLFTNCAFGEPEEGDFGGIDISDAGADIVVDDCYFSSGAVGQGCITIFAVARVVVQNCNLRSSASGASSCIYINADPDITVLNCVMETRTASADIRRFSSTVTNAIIRNNVMTNGMDRTIQTVDPIKRVGGDIDFYEDIIEAVASIPAAGEAIVQLNEDVAIGSALAPPSAAITVDGQGFALSAGAGQPIMTIGAGDVITFKDIALVGSIDINGSGAICKFLENVVHTGLVDIIAGDAGTGFFCKDSVLTGDSTDQYCIRVADADPVVNIWNSYLQGDAGDPAIWMDTVTNDNIQVAFSTVLHGDGGANQAMQVSAAQQPDFNGHHNAWTEDTDTGAYNNRVAAAQRQDTIDANVEFSWLK